MSCPEPSCPEPSCPEPVALLTGSNRGCGLAIATSLHKRGYRVFSLNRTLLGDDRLGEIACDLTDTVALTAGVEQVLATTGRLDAVVSNAVDRVLEPIAQLSVDDWDRLVATNLTAVFRLVKATLEPLRRSRGIFVAMGSNADRGYFGGGVAYSATKAAVRAVIETLLLEERPNGVRACLVTAGAIANLDGDHSPYKMTPAAVGDCVATIVDSWAGELVVSEIDIRPICPAPPPVAGIDRLLHV